MLQLELQGSNFVRIRCKEVTGFKEKNTVNPSWVHTRFTDRQKERGRALWSCFRTTASCTGVNPRLVRSMQITVSPLRKFHAGRFTILFCYAQCLITVCLSIYYLA